jgi:hypothetical protein
MANLTKQAFLEQKGENFKKYISGYNPSQKINEYINLFNKEELIPTIATKLIPLKSVNGLENAVSQIMEELTIPDDEKIAVKIKLLAYMNMFIKIVTED